MKTFKFMYIVTSQRLAYVYAEDKEEAENKLMEILQNHDDEKEAIEKVEENYVQTLNEGHLGIDFGSIKEVEDVDEEF